MAQLSLLGPEIMNITVPGRNLERNTLNNLYTVAFQSGDFARIIGQQCDLLDIQVTQDLRADSIVPQIFFETQLQIRFDCVAPLVLQRIGPDLVRQTDAATLLGHVNEDPFAAFIDQPQRLPNLIAAVATLGAEHITG